MVYVLISLGVFGTLTTTQVVAYGETAIAEAARPALGDAGFTVMAVAALLSTAASTNATLKASVQPHRVARGGAPVPAVLLGGKSRLGPHAGLLITAGAVLIVANAVDLSAIASVGSAVALAIFLLVGVAGGGAARTPAATRRSSSWRSRSPRRCLRSSPSTRSRTLRRCSSPSSPSGSRRWSSTRSHGAGTNARGDRGTRPASRPPNRMMPVRAQLEDHLRSWPPAPAPPPDRRSAA